MAEISSIFVKITNMKLYSIYLLFSTSDPQKIRYVGITQKSAKERFLEHKYCAKSDKRTQPVHKWMYSEYQNGFDIKYKIIEHCCEEIWEDREKFWISFYRKEGWLLNLQSGGFGLYTKNMREIDGKERTANAHRKPLIFKKENEVLCFNSGRDAAKYFNVPPTSISLAVRKKRKFHGYIVEYDTSKPKPEIKNYNSNYNKKITVFKFDLDGNLIGEFPSIRNAMYCVFGKPQSVDFFRKKILDQGKIWHNAIWATSTNGFRIDDSNFKFVVKNNEEEILFKSKTLTDIAKFLNMSINQFQWRLKTNKLNVNIEEIKI